MKFCAFLVLPLITSAMAAEMHVSPAGDDAADGRNGAPVATLARARDLARASAGKETVTVRLADGVYYLPETIAFTSEDSGTEEYPVVWKAETEGKVVVSGGMKLNLAWKPWKDGIFQAETPAGFEDRPDFRFGRAPAHGALPELRFGEEGGGLPGLLGGCPAGRGKRKFFYRG